MQRSRNRSQQQGQKRSPHHQDSKDGEIATSGTTRPDHAAMLADFWTGLMDLIPFSKCNASEVRLGTRPPSNTISLRRGGTIGASLGVPCAICLGEDGAFKTLHCHFKVHVACLKTFWTDRVAAVGNVTEVTCPCNDVGLCDKKLTVEDLRGVIHKKDIVVAEKAIQSLDARQQKLVEELALQSECVRPSFQCLICLTEHEVEGSCTLPCGHRFCYESLHHHFDLIVRERRLNSLVCPVDGCGMDLRPSEHTHILQQCLPEQSYYKLLAFLAREDPRICQCGKPGCEEFVFWDENDDPADLVCASRHRFCRGCDAGPHPRISCAAQQRRLEEGRRQEEHERAQREHKVALQSALQMGWKPCPRRCVFGGGFKASDECDHVRCQCGFEFCWDCGVARAIPLAHDNRWHKPTCRYYTPPSEVTEKPKRADGCPACQALPPGAVCSYPLDDGYPNTYVQGIAQTTQWPLRKKSSNCCPQSDCSGRRKKKISFCDRPQDIDAITRI